MHEKLMSKKVPMKSQNVSEAIFSVCDVNFLTAFKLHNNRTADQPLDLKRWGLPKIDNTPKKEKSGQVVLFKTPNSSQAFCKKATHIYIPTDQYTTTVNKE